MKTKVTNLFRGRLNRRNFAIGLVIDLIAFFIVAIIAPSNISGVLEFFYLLIFAILFILYVSLFLRRMHDFGWSAWYFILIGIPLVNWYFLYCVFLREGSKDKNKYGDKPNQKIKFPNDIFNL